MGYATSTGTGVAARISSALESLASPTPQACKSTALDTMVAVIISLMVVIT
jgi:hypothetical protein